ncbi:MAG: hypothetical protein CM15mP90_5390 [Actinomycetota bacterium]|nr:MAG: hypothetical protein CM15mP90_5390 [Actinomycetota bacterium]
MLLLSASQLVIFGSALTGFICGVLAGVLTAVLFGVLSYNLGADEVLAGLAINIFAIAGTRYLLETLFKRRGFFLTHLFKV